MSIFLHYLKKKKLKKKSPQKVVQPAKTTLNEADVTSLNPLPHLCGYLKKKKNCHQIAFLLPTLYGLGRVNNHFWWSNEILTRLLKKPCTYISKFNIPISQSGQMTGRGRRGKQQPLFMEHFLKKS